MKHIPTEEMLINGWKWEGGTPKGQDYLITEEIEPWKTIACTESEFSFDYCEIWSKDVDEHWFRAYA